MSTNKQAIAMRISWNTIIVNALLSAFKLVAGLFAHSSAMLSDAVHSLSDVFSTVIVMVGIRLAGKEADQDHPYGHERLECVAAILLSGTLFATGLAIGYSGISTILRGAGSTIPGTLALVAAAVSILVKEGMYWYTRAGAKKIGSGALLADAWHHRSDALSSVGSFVGILGARIGLPVLDQVAGVAICVFILKAALDIFRDAISKMTDRACDDAFIQQIHAVVAAQEDVLRVDQVKTRLFGDRVYVDVEFSADHSVTLQKSHDTAQQVHDAIESRFPQVKHCMVHVNPLSDANHSQDASGWEQA